MVIEIHEQHCSKIRQRINHLRRNRQPCGDSWRCKGDIVQEDMTTRFENHGISHMMYRRHPADKVRPPTHQVAESVMKVDGQWAAAGAKEIPTDLISQGELLAILFESVANQYKTAQA
jgi:hypothetical protein